MASEGATDQEVYAGQAISTIKFTAGGTATSISVSNLPAGLIYDVDNLTLSISGIPTESGSYTVSASDGTQTTSISGRITLKNPSIVPAHAVCIDLTKGDVPSIVNGGIPSEWEGLSITVNNTKSEWTANGFKMGGNADYIVIDFRNYEDAYIDEVSFDVTIPNLDAATGKNTIGYRFTEEGTNSKYTIGSPATEMVTLNAPEQSTIVWIQRTASTGTTISEICIQLKESTSTDITESHPATALQIVGETLVNKSGKAVQIFNMQGKLVASGNGDIDISGYNTGIYIARSIDGTNILKFRK